MAMKDDCQSLMLSKFALLERMEGLLDDQRRDLAADDIVRLIRACDEIDKIIAEIRIVDERLADLAPDGCPERSGFEEDVDEVSSRIMELSAKNKAAIEELLRKLSARQAGVKIELDGTVAMSQISGYRPYEIRRPVYLDSRN